MQTYVPYGGVFVEISRLEHKILGLMRRYRWSGFRDLSMAELTHRSGGAFREVTVALINLEQQGYLYWPDKSSLRHIELLRSAYRLHVLLPLFLLRFLKYGQAAPERQVPNKAFRRHDGRPGAKPRPMQLRQSSKRRRSAD